MSALRETRYETPDLRILIDCAGVSTQTPVTGVPRVVFKYIEHGYEYGRRNGVTVLPVYVTREGVFDARYNLPGWTLDAPIFDETGATGRNEKLLAESQRSAIQSGDRHHRLLRRTVAPIVRAMSARSRSLRVHYLAERLTRIYHRRRFRQTINIARKQPVTLGQGDVIFMPAWWHDEAPRSYWDAQSRGAVIVPLLHDVLPITMPDAYEPTWRAQFRTNVLEIVLKCDHLMYVSNATRRDLRSLIGPNAEPEGSVRYHGFDYRSARLEGVPPAQELVEFLDRRQFTFLMVGTIESKKNHLAVIAACRELWSRGIKFQLLIVGRTGSMAGGIESAINVARIDPVHGRNIAWFTSASDADLEHAYRSSAAIILASAGEGFGLPLIEALAAKLPALASDICVFHEIGGDHVAYFDHKNISEIVAVLAKIVTDREFYEDARRRAASFEWPDWSTCCNLAFDALGEVVRSSPLRRSLS